MPKNSGCYWRFLAVVLVVVGLVLVQNAVTIFGFAMALLALAELADIRAIMVATWKGERHG